jgi:hypothetical protein
LNSAYGHFTDAAAAQARREQYRNARERPSDINEHLHLLALLATRCGHVTEMGTRTGVSTRAFLDAQPTTLVCYDIQHFQTVEETLMPIRGRTDLKFIQADTLKIEIEETDLLFVDTLHTGAQLRQELALHGNKARKYLVFHDTETFGEVGEDGRAPGLNAAIYEFFDKNPRWSSIEKHRNNNGLTILRSKDA